MYITKQLYKATVYHNNKTRNDKTHVLAVQLHIWPNGRHDPGPAFTLSSGKTPNGASYSISMLRAIRSLSATTEDSETIVDAGTVGSSGVRAKNQNHKNYLVFEKKK